MSSPTPHFQPGAEAKRLVPPRIMEYGTLTHSSSFTNISPKKNRNGFPQWVSPTSMDWFKGKITGKSHDIP